MGKYTYLKQKDGIIIPNNENNNAVFAGDIYSKDGKLIDENLLSSNYATKEELNTVKNNVSNVYKYKGSCHYLTLADIAADSKIGDVWNVQVNDTDTNPTITDFDGNPILVSNGDNVAWAGTGWDKLAATVDLTGYLTKEEFGAGIDITPTEGSENLVTSGGIYSANIEIANKLKYYDDADVEITPEEEFRFEPMASTIDGYTGNRKNIVIPYVFAAEYGCTDLSGFCEYNQTLNSVLIPKNVLGILSSFNYASSLKTINLDHISDIWYSFNECNFSKISLSKILNLSNSFNNCKNLTEITIPSCLSREIENCFNGCTKLKTVYFESRATINSDSFTGCAEDIVFYVHAGSQAEQWCIENNKDYQHLSSDETLLNYQGEVLALPENPKPYHTYKLLKDDAVGNKTIVFDEMGDNLRFYYNQTEDRIYIEKEFIRYCISPEYTDTPITKLSVDLMDTYPFFTIDFNFSGVEYITDKIAYGDRNTITFKSRGYDGEKLNLSFDEMLNEMGKQKYSPSNLWITGVPKEYYDYGLGYYPVTVTGYRKLSKDSIVTFINNEYKTLYTPPIADDAPTKDSENLITSGGIYEALEKDYPTKDQAIVNFGTQNFKNGNVAFEVAESGALTFKVLQDYDWIESYLTNGVQFAIRALTDVENNEIHVNEYSKKPTVYILEEDTDICCIDLYSRDNTIYAYKGALPELHFNLRGSFSPDYTFSTNFTSGARPTEVSYEAGVINWVGTDCALKDGMSIFSPVANKRYNIVIYFDGITFVGCVNGFTPATVGV